MKRRMPRGAIVVVLACALACGRAKSPASTPVRPALQAVSLPDISGAAPAVQQQLRERFAALQSAIARPDTPAAPLAAAYGEMGKLFIAAEYYRAAGTCFDNARALEPGEMRWAYFRGHVARFENDPAAAAGYFEAARARAPGHVPTLVWLAEMYLARNRFDDAEPLLARALALDPRSGAASYGLGRVALERRDYSTAVARLESALALVPEGTRAHYLLALAYRGLGDRVQAEKHLRQRGEGELPPADPLLGEVARLLQNAAAFETRGVQAMDARQWPEAISSLRKAVELSPDNAFTRLNLGTSLYMSGSADAALEQYRAAVRLSPGLAKAHFGIGVIMEARHQDREAIEAFTAAVHNDAGYAEARFSLANALRRSGRVRESLPHYEEIVRANPAISQASFGLAMGLIRLGRYREARARLERDVAAFSDQPGFTHALARVLAASPDDAVRDGARALALTEGLLKTQRSPALAETMAMALAEVGRFRDAVQWQREALERARQGGRTAAIAHLTDVLRLYESGRPCRVPWSDDDPVHHPEPLTQ